MSERSPLRCTADSQKDVHLTGFPSNWGSEIFGSWFLVVPVVAESTADESTERDWSTAGGSVPDESVGGGESVRGGSV